MATKQYGNNRNVWPNERNKSQSSSTHACCCQSDSMLYGIALPQIILLFLFVFLLLPTKLTTFNFPHTYSDVNGICSGYEQHQGLRDKEEERDCEMNSSKRAISGIRERAWPMLFWIILWGRVGRSEWSIYRQFEYLIAPEIINYYLQTREVGSWLVPESFGLFK